MDVSNLTEQAREVMISIGVVDYALERYGRSISRIYLHGCPENVRFFYDLLNTRLDGRDIEVEAGLEEFRGHFGIDGGIWNLDVDNLVRLYLKGSLNKSHKDN